MLQSSFVVKSIAEQRDTTSTLTTAHHHNITLESVPLNKRTFLIMQDDLDLMLILASMKLCEHEVTSVNMDLTMGKMEISCWHENLTENGYLIWKLPWLGLWDGIVFSGTMVESSFY
ncbi:hypothetical protein P5673_006267 [Acropora cervicornis]|uniref:Uncharacterized protein n=1 Tax=Acropora cervicornis TaxID=6130 RepID=A0AAD9QY07_ACRCE|nr:hypothetical protein P5673_006267 [Acropora cervicornis]